MLSLETMGVLALAVLWVNTLLIAADALRRHGALGRRLAELQDAKRGGRLEQVVVRAGSGEGGAFATRVVEQVGRAVTVSGPKRILFTDKTSTTRVEGGEVEIGARVVRVRPSESAELWCGIDAAAASAATFDAAWPSASTFKGFRSSTAHRVTAGDRVWVCLCDDGEPRGVTLVSVEDPIAVLGRARRPLVGLVVLALGGGALVTVLALWPPVFGVVSTVGGAAALGFFLGIQPLGTAARDGALLPDRRPIGGLWQRPG